MDRPLSHRGHRPIGGVRMKLTKEHDFLRVYRGLIDSESYPVAVILL